MVIQRFHFSCYNRFMKSHSIIIYTDGSSLGNPGPGGFGCVIVFQEKDHVVELGGYARETTNNKMELTAIITALEYLKNHHVSADTKIVIHTDSSYAINGITKWVFGWQKNNWVTSTKSPVLNSELWKQFVPLTKYFSAITFDHVRGHAGVWGNERCDMIATSFASKKTIELFNGKLSRYDDRILSKQIQSVSSSKKTLTIAVSTNRKVISKKAEKSTYGKGSGKAHSYVAQVNGKVYTFEDWDSCKAAVYGRSAKYKKVFSAAEEKKLIQEWNS